MEIAFFKMPKVASSSIGTALEGRCQVIGHSPEEYRVRTLSSFRRDNPDAFVFTFVRNPFDRLLSAYAYLSRHQWSYYMEAQRRCIEPYRDLEDFVLRGVGSGEVLWQEHMRPQYSWVVGDDGRLLVDWIGRYESLQADFDRISDMWKWPRMELGVSNSSEHGKYRVYYNAPMVEVVLRVFEVDFVLGGYEKRLEG